MKTGQIRLHIILACVGLLTLPATGHAQLTFITNNGAITITGYTNLPSNAVVVIPGTTNNWPVTSIGESAFSHDTNLASVSIPNSITNIGYNAFYFCTGMTNVTMGTNVQTIGSSAFESCWQLHSVTIPKSVTNVGDDLFQSSGLGSVTIDNNAIGSQEFYSCGGLTNAAISTNVTSIGTYAFGGCSFTNIVIPNSVTNIGPGAFWFTYLQSVTISDGVIAIGGGAFQGTRLTSIAIPSSITSIGDIAFNSCDSLTNIEVDVSNLYFSSVNGILFDKNQTTLVQYPGGLGGSYTVPNGTDNIGEYAFANCDLLTSVYFDGNAPTTDWTAFYADNNVTAYYLTGTSGWADFSAESGVTAVLWNPQAQTADGSFGIGTNGFGFNIAGSSNLVIVVEAATNLANPLWSPVSTNSLNTVVGTNGVSYFSDPQWANYSSRFYRFSSP